MNEGKKYYFDTSAILPYYRQEDKSDLVEKMLCSLRPPVIISDLSRVEFVSAIARLVRMAEITEPQANLIDNMFTADNRAGLFMRKSLGPLCYQQAEKWISARKTSLRTLDALHLACCLTSMITMVTCNNILHQSAEILGVPSLLI